MTNLLLHPVTLILAQVLLTALVTGLTSANSLLRPVLFPVILLLAYLIIVTLHTAAYPHALTSVVGGNAPAYLLQYLDLCLLHRWDHAARRPTVDLDRPPALASSATNPAIRLPKPPPAVDDSSVLSRAHWGFATLLSPRHLGTPAESAHSPRWTPRVPLRSAYLVRAAVTAVVCFTIVDVLSVSNDPAANAAHFPQWRVPLLTRLPDVGVQELVMRVAVTVAVWGTVYCLLTFGHAVLGVMCVATGLSGVEMWRPVFGEVREAWSVRRFWG